MLTRILKLIIPIVLPHVLDRIGRRPSEGPTPSVSFDPTAPDPDPTRYKPVPYFTEKSDFSWTEEYTFARWNPAGYFEEYPNKFRLIDAPPLFNAYGLYYKVPADA